MSPYTLRQAATLIGGEITGHHLDVDIRTWAYDSRLPFTELGTCFLALSGTSRSGAQFLEKVFARGVLMYCLTPADYDRIASTPLAQNSGFWIVENVLNSVQALAAFHRCQLKAPVIGITGSNGKTIVKEWLYTLLGGAGEQIYRSPGSFNSQLGVALSLLAIPINQASPVIIEAGVSQAGEMERLAHMIQPEIVLFTNLGAAHDAGFDSRALKAMEKLGLAAFAKTLIFCNNDPLLGEQIAIWKESRAEPSPELDIIDWSSQEPAPVSTVSDLRYTVLFSQSRLELRLCGEGMPEETIYFPCPFLDFASRENLVHALLTALNVEQKLHPSRSFDGIAEVLRQRVPELPSAQLRLQVYAGRDGSRIVDDSYNADREGLDAAASFFVQHALLTGRRIWILGPLSETQLSAQDSLSYIEQLAQLAKVDELWLVGLDGVLNSISHRCYSNVDDLLLDLDESDLSGATVLVKGPRRMRLERISRRLRQRSHDLRLELELSALAHNINTFRARLQPSTRICVMVKAQAYGSGGAEIARFFEERGVDYLAVATVDEGIEIRKAGCKLPIIVAHVLPEELDLVLKFQLEPEVSSMVQLRLYSQDIGSSEKIGLHLKFDTGMHRLGFNATEPDDEELRTLWAELGGGGYRVVSAFSHLSASDKPEADEFSRKQNKALERVVTKLSNVLGFRPMMHLLNSTGVWRLPDLQHDMVRLGIGIYGLGLEEIAPQALQKAHRLIAQIVQIREVAPGEVVGYNLGGRADHWRRIGVVNIGYADGLRRSASDGRYAFTRDGKRAPTVGSVCMDFTMIDLSDSLEARVGDEVEIFGQHQSVLALAAVYDTIAYEVFTGIGQRVRRVYYR